MFAVCSPLSFAVLGAISNVGFGRRSAVAGAVAAAVLELPFPAFAGSKEDQAAEQIRLASAALHNLILNKSDFVQALVEGRSDGIQLPPAVPFTTFQALENTAEPEFMSVNEAVPMPRPPLRMVRPTPDLEPHRGCMAAHPCTAWRSEPSRRVRSARLRSITPRRRVRLETWLS